MKSFVHWLLPQFMQVAEEYLINHKSNFTGDSLYMQKDLILKDPGFCPAELPRIYKKLTQITCFLIFCKLKYPLYCEAFR